MLRELLTVQVRRWHLFWAKGRCVVLLSFQMVLISLDNDERLSRWTWQQAG